MTDVLRVLVCGGRMFGVVPNPHSMPPPTREQIEKAEKERDTLFATLDNIQKVRGKFARIICGGASGADWLAQVWARSRDVQCHIMRANWSKFGKAAGPIRNAAMLRDGRPHIVVAFPGGPGTKDMVTKARAGGYEVIEVPAI